MKENMIPSESSKKNYSTPKLVTHGDVAKLTQHLDFDRDDERSKGCASHLFDCHPRKC
jgi:hypothetical protein